MIDVENHWWNLKSSHNKNIHQISYPNNKTIQKHEVTQ